MLASWYAPLNTKFQYGITFHYYKTESAYHQVFNISRGFQNTEFTSGLIAKVYKMAEVSNNFSLIIPLLLSKVEMQGDAFDILKSNINAMYLVIMGSVIIFMQAGFGFLEAGSIRAKNTTNILIKNFVDLTFGNFLGIILWSCCTFQINTNIFYCHWDWIVFEFMPFFHDSRWDRVLARRLWISVWWRIQRDHRNILFCRRRIAIWVISSFIFPGMLTIEQKDV